MYYMGCTKATMQIFYLGVKGTWLFLPVWSPRHRSSLQGRDSPRGPQLGRESCPPPAPMAAQPAPRQGDGSAFTTL